MSTVAEIKSAIQKLSPRERGELEASIWPDWDRAEGDNPPGLREKLVEAAKGRFLPGDRSNVEKFFPAWDEPELGGEQIGFKARPHPCPLPRAEGEASSVISKF